MTRSRPSRLDAQPPGTRRANRAFLDRLRAVVSGVAQEAREDTEQAMLSVLRAGGTSLSALVRLVSNPETSLETRETACWFLGRLDDRRALPAFLSALRANDASLRGHAARELGFLGVRRAVKPLVDLLLTDRDDEVRKAAAVALGSIHAQRAMEPMLRVLTHTTTASPGLRGMVAEQLARFNSSRSSSRSVRILIDVLEDPSPEVRFWAAYALGALSAREAIPALERLAATDDATLPGWWSVKKEAADAIATIKIGITRGLGGERNG
jgi:HEAT repeat protein